MPPPNRSMTLHGRRVHGQSRDRASLQYPLRKIPTAAAMASLDPSDTHLLASAPHHRGHQTRRPGQAALLEPARHGRAARRRPEQRPERRGFEAVARAREFELSEQGFDWQKEEIEQTIAKVSTSSLLISNSA